MQNLVGKRLCYGIKSPDTDLYDLGFGPYTLHAICPIEIRDRSGAERYDMNTPSEQFRQRLQRLIGRRVRRVALSDKNDLWLDFDVCHMVLVSWEDGEESWRLFRVG